MKRWVNDNNVAEKIAYGYRPVLPFEVMDVGGGQQAMKMEMTESDYRSRQEKKQIDNDRVFGLDGFDLEAYIKDINIEAKSLIHSLSRWQLISLAVRKLFNFDTSKCLDTWA